MDVRGEKMKKGMKFNQFVPWVILLCCVILIIGFFIPSFKFSCAGYGSVGVSALNASFGYSYMGESIVNALVYPLLLLLIPIGVGVICFIRKIGEKIKAIIVAGSFFVELVIYIILAILAASIARELGCDEAVTAMYIINLFFSVVGILAGVFLIFEDKFMGMIDKAGAAKPAAPPAAPPPVVAPPAPAAPAAPAAGQTFCPNCGTPQNAAAAFCANCGTPIPKAPPVPQTPVCPGCGQEIKDPNAAFCVFCGTKLK
ncbi:MAG: zinc ribbon domain-containing protein [Lachnospiraceae bacterium]|nr:zinc ribbon domain-containing protein [Lachnospiraceae bacterium]